MKPTDFLTDEMIQEAIHSTIPMRDEAVNHPDHYNQHPSGVECITIAEHYNFNIGNVIKYIWRAGLKGDSIIDLEKAELYLKREINLRKGRTE